MEIQLPKKIWRVENPDANHGLWYNTDGSFNNFIVDKMVDAKCRDLPMGFDENMILGSQAWISATDSIEELHNWMSESDIRQLSAAGFHLNEYDVSDYRQVPGHVVFTRDRVIAVRRLSFEILGVKL
jgi:hypothetical protein